MKIVKIKKLSNNKYKIELDNGVKLNLYDDVIIDNNLLYKKEIDDNLLCLILSNNNYYEIYNKILKMISSRLRSEKEINEYLNKFDFEEEEKEKILTRLKSSNLINDEYFAKAYISDKLYLSNYGPNKIKSELLNHEIDESLIDNLLSEIDDSIIAEKIDKYVAKKYNSNSKYSDYILKQKLINELINLGFDKSDIMNALSNIEVDNSKFIKKDYDKIYNKLKSKYSGNDLNYKIKEKLYQKGYSSDEINKIININ